MKIIAGLGNPGADYAQTRHNIGFQVVDILAPQFGRGGWKLKNKALVTDIHLQGKKIIIAKPQTYMNNSGEAVAPLIRWYGLEPAELMVVCDDLDLPFGAIRIRKKGGDGGHRGLKSIIAVLGSNEFARLRIGIGRPGDPRIDSADWVLGKFFPQETPVIKEVIEKAARAVQVAVTEGLEKAMNQFNSSGQ